MNTTIGTNLRARIGNTPLLRFDRVAAGLDGVVVLAKAEWNNPGGSIKDRAASNIVAEALKEGKLGGGKTLLDSTSGNTGIAYAMLGAAYGIPVTLCMPSNVSAERKRILRAYGAQIVYTDPGEGSDGAIRKADRRPGVAFCRHAGNKRNLCGYIAQVEGTEPEDSLHLAAARLAFPRYRGREAHGDFDYPEDI